MNGSLIESHVPFQNSMNGNFSELGLLCGLETKMTNIRHMIKSLAEIQKLIEILKRHFYSEKKRNLSKLFSADAEDATIPNSMRVRQHQRHAPTCPRPPRPRQRGRPRPSKHPWKTIIFFFIHRSFLSRRRI